jgi:hypothetical protein
MLIPGLCWAADPKATALKLSLDFAEADFSCLTANACDLPYLQGAS